VADPLPFQTGGSRGIFGVRGIFSWRGQNQDGFDTAVEHPAPLLDFELDAIGDRYPHALQCVDPGRPRFQCRCDSTAARDRLPLRFFDSVEYLPCS